PLDECIARDALRSGDSHVGEDVIRGMHQRYLAGRKLPLPAPVESTNAAATYPPPADAPRAVLVDIDGTVAVMSDRSPYDMTRVDLDAPNHAVISAVRAMEAAGHLVVFCSGRTDDCRDATESWLRTHVGVPFA